MTRTHLSEQGEEVATDGGHDLEALREGIASTVAADDDRTRCFGDYRFSASDDWNDVEKHVTIDYNEEPFWMVIPFGLADVVLDELEERVDDDQEVD